MEVHLIDLGAPSKKFCGYQNYPPPQYAYFRACLKKVWPGPPNGLPPTLGKISAGAHGCICIGELHLSFRSILAAGALSSYLKARLGLGFRSDLYRLKSELYIIPLDDGPWDERELVTVLGGHVPNDALIMYCTSFAFLVGLVDLVTCCILAMLLAL